MVRKSLFFKFFFSYFNLSQFNSFSKSKKAISPVVATALLLVVAVVSVVGFASWFDTFKSELFVDVEQQGSISNLNVGIETLVGETLYFRSGDGTQISSVSIDGVDCTGLNGTYSSGMQSLNVSNCLESITSSRPEIVVVTNRGILSKYVFLSGNSGGSGSGGLTGICNDLPGEWIEVPGNSYFGTSNFCVMKYEAKAYDNSTLSYISDGGVSLANNWANLGEIEAHSVADARPWVRINQTNARQACENLNNGGAGNYHLITNAQWMTIARNVAAQENNWADGIIGSNYSSGGGLYVGNVGNIESTFQSHSCNHGSSLDGSTAGTNCLVSGGLHDDRNKRTLILSNGEEIWDLSGNVWQWNNDTLNMHTWDEGGSNGYWNTISNETFRFNAGPLNLTWRQFHGVGYVFHSTTQTNGFLRGGDWGFGANAGAFALGLVSAPSSSSSFLGFRCSYEP